jgi:hypothetical protein
MKKEIIEYEDVVEFLADDGIMEEPDMNWILEYIESEYGCKLDYESGWAKGGEGLLIYTESTADNYDVYAVTSDHNGVKDFGSDVYYYVAGEEFSERALESLLNYQDVWIADHVWDEMEPDFDFTLAEWWSEVYEDLHSEKVDGLIEEGYEYLEEGDTIKE